MSTITRWIIIGATALALLIGAVVGGYFLLRDNPDPDPTTTQATTVTTTTTRPPTTQATTTTTTRPPTTTAAPTTTTTTAAPTTTTTTTAVPAQGPPYLWFRGFQIFRLPDGSYPYDFISPATPGLATVPAGFRWVSYRPHGVTLSAGQDMAGQIEGDFFWVG